MFITRIFSIVSGALLLASSAVPLDATPMKGTLTIDSNVPDANPFGGTVIFTVSDPKKVAGVTIPEEIRGGTFETTVSLEEICAGDTTAGGTLLRFRERQTAGTVFKALVTSGATGCLFLNGATRVGGTDDPFIGNLLNSALGEGALWFAQILQADQDGNTEDNETETRDFFGVPVDKTAIKAKVFTPKSSQTSVNNRQTLSRHPGVSQWLGALQGLAASYTEPGWAEEARGAIA